MLEALNVSYSVRGLPLLSQVCLKAEAGQVLSIIGPNGAGKSTLLRILAGELLPTAGLVQLDGVNIAGLKPYQLAERRAVVPQATHLGFPFTAAEVVALGQSVPGFANIQCGAGVVHSAMEKAGILNISQRSYQALSGGERQRVHFARALCQLLSSRTKKGQILLLDEVTSNLDLAFQLQVLSEAHHMASRGNAVVAVLHDWNLAARFSDRMLLLSEGRTAAIGAPSSVLTDERLSSAFGCQVRCNQSPVENEPYVLPQLCSL